MDYCLRDKRFTQDEADAIAHLQALFGISDQVHNQIHQAVCKKVYEASVKEVLSDAHLSGQEKAFLEKIGKDLELPEEMKKRIYEQEAASLVRAKVNATIEDGMLSPEEEDELNTIASSLGASISHDEASQAVLRRYRLMWRIKSGEMPTVHVDINLQRGEVCYFYQVAEWHETRKVRTGVTYAGPSMRIKIAKGLYWNMGHIRGSASTADVMQMVDAGVVYLTNKRILFCGARKNLSIKLGKILDFTPYSDGVCIQKDAGKNPLLKFSDGVDIFCAMLARAISDDNE